MTREQIIILLRKECDLAGHQKAWSKANNISATYVSDVLAGRCEPGGKLLAALGVERVVSYRKIGREK